MFSKLSHKIMLTYLLLVVVTTVGLSLFLPRLLEDYFFRAKQKELIRKGLRVADIMANFWNVYGRSGNIDYLIRAAGQSLDAGVVVIDRDGRVMAGSPGMGPMWGDMGPMGGDMARLLERSEYIQATMEGKIVSYRGVNPHLREAVLTVGVPILGRSGVQGAVFLYAPVAGLTPLIAEVQKLIRNSTVAVGALALLLGYLLSRTITRPLSRVIHAAQEVSAGNLDVRVEADAHDEIGQLSAAFNHMTSTLRSTINALSYEKNRVQQMIANMAEGVLAVSEEGNILLANERLAKMYGLTQEELIGRPLSAFEVLEDVRDIVSVALEAGETCSMNSGIDHGGRSVIIHATPLVSDTGTQWGAVVLVQDITELEKVEKLRQQVVANVSHELRTPLTIIRGCAEALENEVIESPETRRAYLASIREEADRLNRLVTELLDLSKIQSGGMHLNRVACSIREVTELAITRLSSKAEQKNIEIRNLVPADLPDAYADVDRIVQVMVNLLANAIQFTPSGGLVEVRAEARDGLIETSVSDTGIGIPPEHLPHIWERFYKVDKARPLGDSGTGLGLSIVKSIVEAHGGSVGVESQEGVGSTFTFTLPIACG